MTYQEWREAYRPLSSDDSMSGLDGSLIESPTNFPYYAVKAQVGLLWTLIQRGRLYVLKPGLDLTKDMVGLVETVVPFDPSKPPENILIP